ncbi:MAG: vanadium-dependent haloperoxidase [Acidobacteriaceae bacterium]|nr:vanadium-dependent haloperoxidase [Acidobacteriaceae bacterium]
MKPLVVTSLMISALVCSVRADEVTDWNQVFYSSALVAKTSPLVVLRQVAITEVSVFDAVNGIDRRYTPIHVQEHGPRGACFHAAAIQAAYAALVRLYPDQKNTFDQKRSESLAALQCHHHHDYLSVWAGIEWGQRVADAIWAWRSTDGFNKTLPPFDGGSAIGEWRPTPPAFLPGALPQMASMETWVIESHDQFRPVNGPNPLDSARYAQDFNETKQMGSVFSWTRSADQTLAAQFWGNSSSPSYFWNHVAISLLDGTDHSLVANARLFALLNVAMADAGIACWDAKYYFSSWRPITAIALADQDGNPLTQADVNWKPLLVTPPFPEYPSAHSAVSSAGTAVLAKHFGSNIAFTVSSDVMTNVTRQFTSFSAALDEIRSARVNAGIHFRTACNDAQELGEEVASYAMEHACLRLEDRDGGDDDYRSVE